MTTHLEVCRLKVRSIGGILSEKKRSGDVVEFLITIKFVADVLEEYARRGAPDADARIQRVAQVLAQYDALLNQLLAEGRLARFLTSNRVRRKLELLNAGLHKEVSAMFIILREKAKPGTRVIANPVKVKPEDDLFDKCLADADTTDRALWEESFGELPMVSFDEFWRVYLGRSGAQQSAAASQLPTLRAGLAYLLDSAGTGQVSIYKYSEFLKGFGPLRTSPTKVLDVLAAPYFHGFLSSEEAARLLDSSPPGTFLVRISKSKPGSFALAYVGQSPGSIVHTLVSHAKPHGFAIEEELGNSATGRTFDTLAGVIDCYSYVLKQPYQSSVSREPAFHGDMSSQEAVELLEGHPEGSYLFRFSSQKGFLAVSYVEGGSVQHGKVEMTAVGFKFESEPRVYLTLPQMVADYELLLKVPVERVTPGAPQLVRATSGPRPAPSASAAYGKIGGIQRPGSGVMSSGPTNYSAIQLNGPGATPPSSAAYGAVPQNVRTSNGYGSVLNSIPANPASYGSIPSSPTVGPVRPHPPRGGGYGAVPNALPEGGAPNAGPTASSPYGSTPKLSGAYNAIPGGDPSRAGPGSGGGYGAIPSAPGGIGPSFTRPSESVRRDGSLTNQAKQAGYASIPLPPGPNGDYGHVPGR
mmetsp:Transcript_3889/g.12587  ORF Transcript_3889/g.12587 Transcript_3889/m.12587 type:complete len:639 (-) Transcript_3889:226-2142(-)